jgi:hypothetical protein
MMSNKTHITIFAVVALACCPTQLKPSPDSNSELTGEIQSHASTADGLQLTALALNDSWPPNLKVTLANRSPSPIWISGRFAVGEPGSLFEEVWFDAVQGEARADAVSCRGGAGRPRPSDYVFLPPEAELSHVVGLSCVPFFGSGPWTIVAHYRDRNPQPPAPPPGARWFSGELVSPPVEIAARTPEQPHGLQN